MPELNYLAVVGAAFAAFVTTAVWNTVIFGDTIMKLLDPEWEPAGDAPPAAWKLAVEFVRNLTVAFTLALLLVNVGVTGWLQAACLGFLLWLGFPVMILAGAALWQDEPLKLVTIHAGDWLVKLLLMAVILGALR